MVHLCRPFLLFCYIVIPLRLELMHQGPTGVSLITLKPLCTRQTIDPGTAPHWQTVGLVHKSDTAVKRITVRGGAGGAGGGRERLGNPRVLIGLSAQPPEKSHRGPECPVWYRASFYGMLPVIRPQDVSVYTACHFGSIETVKVQTFCYSGFSFLTNVSQRRCAPLYA